MKMIMKLTLDDLGLGSEPEQQSGHDSIGSVRRRFVCLAGSLLVVEKASLVQQRRDTSCAREEEEERAIAAQQAPHVPPGNARLSLEQWGKLAKREAKGMGKEPTHLVVVAAAAAAEEQQEEEKQQQE